LQVVEWAIAPRGSLAGLEARPQQPILLPKLRIHSGDFPYPRLSTSPEAAHLGDLMRISVRRRRVLYLEKTRFMGRRERAGAALARGLCLCGASRASSGEPIWRAPPLQVNRMGALRPARPPAWRLSAHVAIGKDPRRPLGITTEPAFAPVSNRLDARLASRHPESTTLAREPFSFRQASGVSHEYLLLSPRSALVHAPARHHAGPSSHILYSRSAPRPPTHTNIL